MEYGNYKHRLLIENLPDAFAYHKLIADSSGNPVDYIFLDVNPAFEHMTGLSREQVIGKKAAELLPGIENYSIDWMGTFGKVALTRESIYFEHYFEISDRWYTINAYSDEPGYFVVLFRDITEIKEAEQKLYSFKTSLESSKDAIGMSTPQGPHNYQNKAFSELFGAVGESPKEDNGNITGLVGIHTDITKRKRAEDELQKSEEKYRLLSENASDVIWTTDLDLNYTYISPSVERISGYTVEERMFMGVHNILTPSSMERVLQGIQEELKLEASGEADPSRARIIEVEQYRKDGSTVWVETKASFLRDQDGSPCGILGITRDINDRKKVEEALKASEERLDLAMAVKNEGYWDWNLVTNETFFDDRYYTMAGYAPNEFPQTFSAWAERVCPDDLPNAQLSIQNYFAGKCESYDVEFRFKHKDGSWIWIQGQGKIVERDSNGSPLRMIGTHTDITRRKRTEQELIAQQELLEGVMDNVSDVLAIQKPDHSIERYNQAGYDLLGMNPEEVIGKKCYEFIGRDRECDECATSKALQTKKLEQIEKYFPELDVYLNCRSNPVLDEDGNVVRIVQQLRDITEQKEKEKQIKDSEQRLNNLISQTPAVIYSFILTNGMPKITYINENVKHILGFEPEDFIKNFDLFKECLYPEDSHKVFNAISKLMAEGRVTLEEYRVKDKQGHYHWLHEEQKLITHTDGTLEVVGAWWDITERKNVEEELRESEALNKSIVNIVPDIIFKLDMFGKHLDIITPDDKKLYLPKEKLLGQTVTGILPKEPADIFMHAIEKALLTNIMQTCEYKLTVPAGSLYFEARIMPADGNIVYALVRDITKRKQADEKIRHMSFHDNLTGLYNRHFLEEEMKRLDTQRQLPISIIMADINGLKLVNDTYGHSTGDEMIKIAANILERFCRKEDIIARWGGDEFVILSSQTKEKTALEICKRIHDEYSKTYVKDVPISISSGTASKNHTDKDLKEVLKEAEDNMYKNKLTESRSGKSGVLKALLKTLEEKSYETQAHTRRMQNLALKIGKRIGISDTELSRLGLVITLHDIGKIIVPEEILTKKSALTEEEWDIIKKHPETGYRIALSTEEFAHVAEDILSHHESWDGNGYPRGLKGEEIPLLARITAIVDAYEVMTNGRPYKKARPPEEVVAEIKRCAGTQFDPHLVEVFLSLLKEKEGN